jgi:hypothetical protein
MYSVMQPPPPLPLSPLAINEQIAENKGLAKIYKKAPTLSKGSWPSGILVVCRINLWPAVQMELEQNGWLKQPGAKVREPIVEGDQGLRKGHQCTETSLTGKPNSIVSVLHPVVGKLLLYSNGVTLLPSLVKETSYF